jgi:hypothetical protein
MSRFSAFLNRLGRFHAVSAVAAVALTWGQACMAEEAAVAIADSLQTPQISQLAAEEPIDVPRIATNETPHETPSETIVVPAAPRVWTIDYRIKTFCNSQTSYEVGSPPNNPRSWAPVSQLRFPLDSAWNGVQVGVEKPDWATHVEWLTPLGQHINGYLTDFDWRNPNTPYSDLGYMREHWNDGQTVTFDLERKLSDSVLGLPVEVWPMIGFRWQRFDLTAYDLDQVKYKNHPTDIHIDGDVITFNQQYYMCYLGGQLRRTINLSDQRQLRLIFQGDWGATWAYSIDHHLLPDFYGMQADQGSSWHLGLTGEFPMNQRLTLGVQGDFLAIRTTGKDWEVGRPAVPRTNGVCTYSDQTSVTAFVRLNY